MDKKRSSILWLCLLSVVGLLAVYNVVSDYRDKKEKREMALLMSQSYDINGVKYPSYSQLKYIALNELSHEEVKKFMAICGINQTGASGSSSEYWGDCGKFELHILDRSNSESLICYTYTFFTNNRRYLEKMTSDVMQEKKYKKNDIETTGYIDDYWYTGVSNEIFEGTLFRIFFQRFQDKKLNSQ